MTTSYLFAYYTSESQVSLSYSMSIKAVGFSFWLSVVLLLRFLVSQITTVLRKIFKKSGEKTKLRTIHPKNHENLRTESLGSNFTGSYKKRMYCNLHHYKHFVSKFMNISVQWFPEMTVNTATWLNHTKQFFKGFKIIFPYCGKRAYCITSGLL